MEIGSGPLEMTVVACGPSWLVVDKPCGVSIHNDPGKDVCSVVLAATAAGRLPGMRSGVAGVHPVHRLDRDTSGIVLLAGDPQTRAFFSRQFAGGQVRKEYLAIVHGRLEGPADAPDHGEWDWPLTAASAGRSNPAGQGNRVPCVTRWRVLAHGPHYTLILCMPVSGRRHQIRRHAKLAGHPVVGDRRYGSTRALKYLAAHFRFDRLALHAHRLSIRLPREDQPAIFMSGGLPAQMQRLLSMDDVAAPEGLAPSPR